MQLRRLAEVVAAEDIIVIRQYPSLRSKRTENVPRFEHSVIAVAVAVGSSDTLEFDVSSAVRSLAYLGQT